MQWSALGAAKLADRLGEIQLQVSAVQTAAGLLSAPLILRSTKLPAETVMLPDAEQELPVVTEEQTSVVSAMLEGDGPTRSVTVIDCPAREKTFSAVAVHPAGTQVSAE